MSEYIKTCQVSRFGYLVWIRYLEQDIRNPAWYISRFLVSGSILVSGVCWISVSFWYPLWPNLYGVWYPQTLYKNLIKCFGRQFIRPLLQSDQWLIRQNFGAIHMTEFANYSSDWKGYTPHAFMLVKCSGKAYLGLVDWRIWSDR